MALVWGRVAIARHRGPRLMQYFMDIGCSSLMYADGYGGQFWTLPMKYVVYMQSRNEIL